MGPMTQSMTATSAPTPWADRGGRVVFILSSERSGSTLLRVMLGKHSRIISPSELWLLNFSTYADWRREKPQAIASLREFFELIGAPRTEHQLDDECAGWSSEHAYRWVLSFLPQGRLLVDKTPGYANSPVTLARTAPFAPFYIWLLRHPLGVIDSHVTLQWKRHVSWTLHDIRWRTAQRIDRLRRGVMSSSVRRREEKWVAQNKNIQTFLSSVPGDRKCVLHFEQLVSDSAGMLDSMCRQIGVAPEPAMLDPTGKARPMAKGLGDANFLQHQRIDADPAKRWQARYSESDLMPATRELMRALDVTPSDTPSL